MTEAMVQALALGVTLGRTRVLDGLSLSANARTVLAVVGPNGAGKTTLLRTIARAVEPSDGELVIRAAGGTGYCPQAPMCAWDFTLRELMRLSAHPDAAETWCRRLGVGALLDRRLSRLSGGERRMGHLALAFATPDEPYGGVILLDEPTADLDAARRLAVLEAVARLRASGAAVIVATHDFELARSADSVAVLSEGRLVASGPPTGTLSAEVVRATWGVDPSRC